MLGAALAFVSLHGLREQLLTFIVAHGCVELSVMCLSGAAGAAVGEALARPGEAGRIESFRVAALRSGKLLIACVLLLVGAGLIEGYVSPNPRCSAACARIVIGVSYWLLMVLMLSGWLFGRPRQLRRNLHTPRTSQRLVLREHRRLESLGGRGDHRRAQMSQQRALRGGARLVLGRGQRDPRILPGVRLALRQRADLAAVHAGHHHQVRRGEQAHRARQLVGDAGVIEVGEQHDEPAVPEEAAYAHRRRRRIRLRRLHRQLLERAAQARHRGQPRAGASVASGRSAYTTQPDAVVVLRDDLRQTRRQVRVQAEAIELAGAARC